MLEEYMVLPRPGAAIARKAANKLLMGELSLCMKSCGILRRLEAQVGEFVNAG